MNDPSEDHLEAVHYILRYLKMTLGKGLLVKKSKIYTPTLIRSDLPLTKGQQIDTTPMFEGT